MKKVSRITDTASGTCNAHDSPVGWTGAFTTGSTLVKVDGLGVARVGDTGPTSCGHTFRAITGSAVVTADGIPVCREGDAVEVIQGGSGTITSGSDQVKDYS